jgi:hypothetical protein
VNLYFKSVGGVPRPIFATTENGYLNYVGKLRAALEDRVCGQNILIV